MARDDRNQQQLLIDDPNTGYRHRYCRKCGRQLTAQESRLNGFGPDCDPTRRPRAAAVHQVEQDAIPGT
ncbi:DUF6011 domain-containing protein [Streptomyces sp. NBC_00842]|uniref:DUF6011 domain-containing protein n=1 Tax=Streptomyces sp. NBC_00842 TaxID=2975848 RepID=UPI00386663BA|nr:DUF6011 domain-containing protein [Streptomyces sp. NBC_00842]